jgi:hypothetical protein
MDRLVFDVVVEPLSAPVKPCEGGAVALSSKVSFLQAVAVTPIALSRSPELRGVALGIH